MSGERESTPPNEPREGGATAVSENGEAKTERAEAKGDEAPKDGKREGKRDGEVERTLPDGTRELETAVAAAAAEVARRKEEAERRLRGEPAKPAAVAAKSTPKETPKAVERAASPVLEKKAVEKKADKKVEAVEKKVEKEAEKKDDAPAEKKDDAPAEKKEDAPAAAVAAKEEPEAEKDEKDAAVAVDAGPEGIAVRCYGRTDVGLVREHNEDNFTFILADAKTVRGGPPKAMSDEATDPKAAVELIREERVGKRGAVFAVCDGMGGAAAGEVASQMAVDTIAEFFTTMSQPRDRDQFARRVVSAIEEAGNRIFSAAKMDRTRRGMGTTATVAGLIDKVLFIGQVGDSRAYLLRKGTLGLVTKDQSLVNQLIEAGQLTEEEAEAFEHSNIILQALGTTEDVTVDLTFLELRRGDRMMMCSDGLSGLVHPDMIKEVLETTTTLVERCERLIEMANAGGGHDNITVLCVDFDGAELPTPSGTDAPLYQQYPLPPATEEDRESLPPRDMRMKEGGRKPGADVKRDADMSDAGEETPPGIRRRSPKEEAEPSRWALIIGVLVLVAILVAIAFAMQEPNVEPVPEDERIEPTRETQREEVVEPAEPAGVEVRVTTDVEGELWVDGELHGPLASGVDVVLLLPPGAHRLEARSGGSTVVTEVLTIHEGDPPEAVNLVLPSGAMEDIGAEGVVEESGGTTGGTMTEVPPPELGAMTGLAPEMRQPPPPAMATPRPTGDGMGGVPPNPF